MTNTENKTSIIKDLTFKWAKLKTPVSPFNDSIYEMQVLTTDQDKATQLQKSGVSVKKSDGTNSMPVDTFYATVKRKAKKRDGTDVPAPPVVDKYGNPVSEDIGNGSVGDIKLFSFAYSTPQRSGIAASLQAVKVTSLVIFEREDSLDFDFEEEGVSASEEEALNDGSFLD